MGKGKLAGVFVCIWLLCIQAPLLAQGQEGETPAQAQESLSLYAASAVLLDAESGRVLYGKNADCPMAMASTTKIMTCITVLERGNPEDVLQVSAYAASMPKVKLYLKKGETYRVKDLLYSLMLESHNDSAVALAEYIGRQLLPKELQSKETKDFTREESRQAVAAFAALMNEKAKELGCENTWFITPNGLDAAETILLKNGDSVTKEHSTTAAELAKIMAYCICHSPQKEAFLQITRAFDYAFSANGRSFSCKNHNAFLNMMPGALSGKTGFTNKAGYCYVGSLENRGRTFVVALLACGWPNHKSYKWSDTRELMQYGMDYYFYRELQGGEGGFDESSLQPLPVAGGKTKRLGEQSFAELVLAKDKEGLPGLLLRSDEQVEIKCRTEKELEAPVQRGTCVGEVTYAVGEQVYRRDRIVTAKTVEKIDFPWCVQQILGRYFLGEAGR